MIYNRYLYTRKLEQEAFELNPKETENLNSYYYGELNDRYRDMSIYCYEYHLKEIIKKAKERPNEAN